MGLSETRGFTLLEVIIASAIFLVGIMGAWKLFPIAVRNNQVANEKTVTSELANDRLSRTRMLGAERLYQPGYDFRRDPALNQTLDATAAASGQYSAYVSSRHSLAGAETTGLQRVTFTVDMPDGRRESYVTYVANQ